MLINPSRDQMAELFRTSPKGAVRALKAPDGRWLAWPAADGFHIEIAESQGLDFKNRKHLQSASFLFSANDIPDDWSSLADLVDRMQL